MAIFLIVISIPLQLAFLGGGSYAISALFTVGIIFLAYKLTYGGRDAAIRMALFAQANKFSYSWKGGRLKALKGLGSVIGEPMKSNVIVGHVDGQPFTMCGIYTYTNRPMMKLLMCVTLPNNYSHIVLDAKQNNFVGSNLHKGFPDNKKINLEGDFPEHFNVYSATTSVESLQILTPELMGRMIDYTHKADIEIVDDQLLLLCNFKHINKEIVQMFFEATEQILRDLGVSSHNSRGTFDSQSRL